MQGLPCVKFGRVVIGVLPLVRMYKFPSRAFGEREQESKTTFIQTQRPLLPPPILCNIRDTTSRAFFIYHCIIIAREHHHPHRYDKDEDEKILYGDEIFGLSPP